MINPLQIDRKIDMYGICNRINAYVDFEPFAIAICDPIVLKSWGVQIIHANGTITDTDIDIGEDSIAAREAVESLIRLSFRSDYARRAA